MKTIIIKKADLDKENKYKKGFSWITPYQPLNLECMQETIITAEEWHETKNIDSFSGKIVVYPNHPPATCPVRKDPNTNDYRIYHN